MTTTRTAGPTFWSAKDKYKREVFEFPNDLNIKHVLVFICDKTRFLQIAFNSSENLNQFLQNNIELKTFHYLDSNNQVSFDKNIKDVINFLTNNKIIPAHLLENIEVVFNDTPNKYSSGDTLSLNPCRRR